MLYLKGKEHGHTRSVVPVSALNLSQTQFLEYPTGAPLHCVQFVSTLSTLLPFKVFLKFREQKFPRSDI
jgi:hypothetical protein